MNVPYGKCGKCGSRYCSNDFDIVDDEEFDPEEEDYWMGLFTYYDNLAP